MKKMFRNKEAVTHNIAVVAVIAVVIIIIAGIAFLYPASSSEQWETETNFGAWGQEVYLEYEDGTLQSLKQIFDSEALTMYHEGNKVTGIYYKLNGKATGSASSIDIDISDYFYNLELWQGSSKKHTHTTDCDYFLNNPKTLTVDGSWHEIFKIHNTVNQMGSSKPSGTYTLKIVPTGSLRYRVGSESWVSTGLPSTVSFTVTISSTTSMSVSFSQGYSVH